MRSVLTVLVLSSLLASGVGRAESPGPRAAAPIPPIAAPSDRAYPGEIHLSVDASDVVKRVVQVHETIGGISGETVLLYPKWLPGTHSPDGPIDRVAGLRVTAQGASVAWTRDPVDVYAFRIHAGAGVSTIELDFQYLSPPNDAA
ncbi:MAG TPA: hypothetical protein VGN77_03705, partial [Steroidobacteraceae bacterium]|nr:hypothetical protein [Steroidobacteraceae bacterium]